MERERISGVFGMVIELFEVDEKFEMCVSKTAGNSLFHVVVDTDNTAARVLQALKKENAGRMTQSHSLLFYRNWNMLCPLPSPISSSYSLYGRCDTHAIESFEFE